MDLAKELVQQQVFFRRELSERVGWLILLRWAAVTLAMVGTLSGYLLGLAVPLRPIITVLVSICLYNIVFFVLSRRLQRISPDHEVPFELCAHAQILCDLSALFVLMYYTGGFFSPMAIFILFHIILAGILLPPFFAYAYAGFAATVLVLLSYFQHIGHLKPVFSPATFNVLLATSDKVTLIIIHCAAFFITAFLVTTIKLSLRLKGRTLLIFCKELDIANAKLTALYEMVKDMAVCTDYQELMDSATRATARIMGVKACSIKLLDDQRKRLRFSSTYGLSQDYLAKGEIDIDRSPINKKIIQGAYYSIGHIEEKDFFQYPENIRKEGIAAMICLPLKVEKRVLGVFCVYSNARFFFSEKDVDFFALITELTALAMQNLKNELNKSWFLKKTAHQLRSPINAVQSILKVLRKSYVGDLNERQSEMIVNCEQRLESLAHLITDLLKLGLERSTGASVNLHPVALVPLLEQLISIYRPQVEAKGVTLNLTTQPGLPPVLGHEDLIDDVLTNLFSNAVKYTPSGKKIDIVLNQSAANQLCLEIVDEGIGIPQKQLPRLFTEFFRAENAKALTEQGTGLGLVIAKQALDHIHGTIHIQSQEGVGTRITCLFPIAAANSEYF